MRFWTSDTHFSHRNIVKFQPNRGRDNVAEMNKDIIKAWNAVVSPEDTVYHLGDVALGPVEEWNESLYALNGRKILVIGNHERIFAENKPAYVERFRPVYERWFDEIHENITNFEIGDHFVNMSHFPYEGDHFDDDRFTERRLPDDGTVLLHGHTHSTERLSRSSQDTLQIHVGWDTWAAPVAETQIEEYLNFYRKESV